MLAPVVGGELVPGTPVLYPAGGGTAGSPETPPPVDPPVDVPVPVSEPPGSVPVAPGEPVPVAVPALDGSSGVASLPVGLDGELESEPTVADELVLPEGLEPSPTVPEPIWLRALITWSGFIVSDRGSDLVGSKCLAAGA